MTSRMGQRLGNYCLLRLLDVGGFTEVYLGKHVYLDDGSHQSAADTPGRGRAGTLPSRSAHHCSFRPPPYCTGAGVRRGGRCPFPGHGLCAGWQLASAFPKAFRCYRQPSYLTSSRSPKVAYAQQLVHRRREAGEHAAGARRRGLAQRFWHRERPLLFRERSQEGSRRLVRGHRRSFLCFHVPHSLSRIDFEIQLLHPRG